MRRLPAGGARLQRRPGGRGGRARFVCEVLVMLLLVAGAARGAELMTFTLRPVLLLESHLYAGGLNNPEAVHVDDDRGEVWVADTKNNLIGVFSKDGMPLFSFGSSRYLREPRLVKTDPHGNVIVLERDRGRLRAFSYRGVYQKDLVPPGLPEKAQIAAFFFAPDATLWIAENGAGEILAYDYPSLRLKRRFGARGTEEGEFQSIAAMAVDAKYVYVLDHTALAVQIFDLGGDFVRGWGQHAMGAANFSLPRGIAVDAKGRIAVTDGLRHDIKYFDLEGRFVGHFGGAGREPGSVLSPSGIAIGNDGRVYVADRGNARIQVFQEEQLAKPIAVP
jgi:tripartite motif-containing protein 71